jgi:hypothetical protein
MVEDARQDALHAGKRTSGHSTPSIYQLAQRKRKRLARLSLLTLSSQYVAPRQQDLTPKRYIAVGIGCSEGTRETAERRTQVATSSFDVSEREQHIGRTLLVGRTSEKPMGNVRVAFAELDLPHRRTHASSGRPDNATERGLRRHRENR